MTAGGAGGAKRRLDPPSAWEENGARDLWGRANARARELPARERPVHLDPAADRAIRERFGVRAA